MMAPFFQGLESGGLGIGAKAGLPGLVLGGILETQKFDP